MEEEQNLPLGSDQSEDLLVATLSNNKTSVSKKTRVCRKCTKRFTMDRYIQFRRLCKHCALSKCGRCGESKADIHFKKRRVCIKCEEAPERRCTHCKQTHPSHLFFSYLPTVCKPCTKEKGRIKIRQQDWFVYITNVAKSRSQHKNIFCDITPDDVRHIWDKQNGSCAISGIGLEKTIDRENLDTASIDRIIPENGYTSNNIQLVSVWANRAKTNLSTTEFNERILSAAKFIKNTHHS